MKRGNMNKTILIVDDRPDFANLLANLLRGEDSEIDTAYSVRAAKQKMDLKKYGYAIIDWYMPDGIDLDIIEDIAGDPEVQFLLLTGSPNRIIEDTVQLYGGKYLQKTDANLLNELKRFLEDSFN